MRILVTGAAGFLGSYCVRELLEAGREVLGAVRSTRLPAAGRPGLVEVAIDDVLRKGFLSASGIDAIVHAAALASVVACQHNPVEAERSNAQLSALLAQRAAEASVPLTLVSTDWAFDGASCPRGGFRESDPPEPVSIYSKTKVSAEQHTAGGADANRIVRISLLYGAPLTGRGGPLQWMVDALRDGKPIPSYTDEWRTPLWVVDAARAIRLLVESRETGLFHVAGVERVNRVQFAAQFLEAFGGSRSLIQERARPSDEVPRRPEDLSLNTGRMREVLGFVPTGLEAAMGYIATNWEPFER